MAAALLAAAPVHAVAASAGSAVGVNPAAAATLEGNVRTLVVGADVFLGELIETGARGQVQIVFADNTRLVVGPSSALVIEDYLIRNDGSAGKLAVDMLSGAFRFATGDSPKDDYALSTPTGTIGIRGTEFDVHVDENGITRILLFSGAATFCTLTGDCETITSMCDVGEIGSTQSQLLGNSRDSTGDTRDDLKAKFVYAQNQTPLLRDFWFRAARDCLNNPPFRPQYIPLSSSTSTGSSPDPSEEPSSQPSQPSSSQPSSSYEPPPPHHHKPKWWKKKWKYWSWHHGGGYGGGYGPTW